VGGCIILFPRRAACASLKFLDNITLNSPILVLEMGVVSSGEPSFAYKTRKTKLSTNQNIYEY